MNDSFMLNLLVYAEAASKHVLNLFLRTFIPSSFVLTLVSLQAGSVAVFFLPLAAQLVAYYAGTIFSDWVLRHEDAPSQETLAAHDRKVVLLGYFAGLIVLFSVVARVAETIDRTV